MEEESLAGKIDRIAEKFEEMEGTKKKQFKLPLGIRLGQGKLKRKSYALVLYIRTNGSTDIRMLKIEDDTIKTKEGNIYDASSDNILRYKNYPLLIIPEWNMKPFSPKENFNKAADDGTLTAAEKLILTKMKLDAVTGKMEMNWKVILLVLAIGAGLLWGLNSMGVL